MPTIRPVRTRAEFSTFVKLPRLLYRGMSGYAPPLDFERRQLLDPKKAKFFEHGEAQYWLAYDGERAVGRISAQIDHLAIETWGENIGCFGCLDAVDDAATVAALVETATTWLRERGMSAMRGPFTLSINGESGVQVEGQERGGMVLMPWHPPYLAGLVEAAGLTPAKDLLAYTVSMKEYRRRDDLMARVEGRLPAGLTLRPLDLRKLGREGEIIRTVFNEAWQNNWSFVPFTPSEIATFTKAFKPFLIPDCGLIAELDGKPVGFALALPNLFDAIAGFGGRLLPFNWIPFIARVLRFSAYRSARIVLFGIVPQLHRIGAPLAFAMIDELLSRSGGLRQVEEVEMSWILEDNRPVTTMMAAFGVPAPSKRYRMFERTLTA